MLFKRGHAPIGRQTMTRMCSENMSCLKRGTKWTNPTGAFDTAHHVVPDVLPIKAPKLKDVKNLLAHVELPDHVTFYSNLYARATVKLLMMLTMLSKPTVHRISRILEVLCTRAKWNFDIFIYKYAGLHGFKVKYT